MGRQVFEGLTKGKNHNYPAGDRDAELDIAQEFAALAAKNGKILPASH